MSYGEIKPCGEETNGFYHSIAHLYNFRVIGIGYCQPGSCWPWKVVYFRLNNFCHLSIKTSCAISLQISDIFVDFTACL